MARVWTSMTANKTIIIDIGTHKSEELNTLFHPSISEFYLLLKETIKFLLNKSKLTRNMIINCWSLFLREKKRPSKKDFRIFALEPNTSLGIKHIRRLEKVLSINYFPFVILGHDNNKSHDLIKLNLYENSLSSSLYSKNNMKVLSSIYCFGFNFENFVTLLSDNGLISKKNRIIVRMNCEGAELGVIESIDKLSHDGYNFVSVLGSLADVNKIHGETAYQSMMNILAKNKLNYVYFKGSDLSTWMNGVNEITRGHHH